FALRILELFSPLSGIRLLISTEEAVFRERDDLIEAGDHSRNTASSVEINNRIPDNGENISTADDIRSPKKDDAVAGRVRPRYMNDLDILPVEMKRLPVREYLRRPRTLRGAKTIVRCTVFGRPHDFENVFVRHDFRSVRLGQCFVTAAVI